MTFISRLAVLSLFVCSVAFGQSTTQEDLGAIPASQAFSGLGWNVQSSNEQEFAAAAAAGATRVRLDSCNWAAVEAQSAPPNNVSAGYSLPANCITGLTNAKRYGLKPTLVAAYGAPYHQILALNLSAAAPAGSTTLSVEYVSGVGGEMLSSISYPNAYVMNANGQSISAKRSYSGTLITGVALTGSGTATLSLSSALTSALASGTSLMVNEVLYPSAVTGSSNDPSVVAFAQYARYLATQLEAYGLSGDVELWNEPPWAQDCWDNRRDCYDTDPGFANELAVNDSNYGFAAALQMTAPVPGVSYVWAGTNKSGGGDLLGTNMMRRSGVNLMQAQPTVTVESMHPYGSNPEDLMWNEPCLISNPQANQACNTIAASGSNMVISESANLLARAIDPSYGINHSITETGASSSYMGDEIHKARFAMRQYLGYMADGFSYIEFYRLFDRAGSGQTGFSFITLTDNNTAYTPLQSYTAMAGLISDLATIKSTPVTPFTSDSLPSVISYSGTYNLDHLALVGARQGDNANSMLYVMWQRSYVAAKCGGSAPCWGTVAQPEEAPTAVSIPSGMKIFQAINLVTREAVSYTQNGSEIDLSVSDDPIELLLIPSNGTASPKTTKTAPRLVFATIPAQIQGGSAKASATSSSTGAVTYSVVSGPATISGSIVTLTGPGTVVLEADQATTSTYGAAVATTSFSVTAKTPNLNFAGIGPKIFGDTVTVRATSVSNGSVSYSVVSGPATISGATVTTTGAGMVVIQATQAISAAYTAATVTTSFQVAPKTPILTLSGVSTKTYGDAFSVSATSASDGAITYTVVSGPATISGSAVTLTGHGQVLLRASQAATPNYNTATTTTSFYVGVKTPALTFTSIPSKTAGAVFTANAASASDGAVTYSVVSGPATHIGSTITITGAGTVVLGAYQTVSSNGGYTSTTTTTSFTVSAKASTLALADISPKTAGDAFKPAVTSPSTGAVTYSVVTGPATISGSTITVTGPGTVVLKASQAATSAYTAATATTSFTVAAKTPSLSFVGIGSKIFGDTVTVKATSVSTGSVNYSVVSGPAIISGDTVTPTAAGTVVIQASQAASGAYAATTTTASFTVAAKAPALTFAAVAAKTFGDVFTISATSASKGAVTYSVLSGPAKIAGSAITLTGHGQVLLQASQAATSQYTAATTTISFYVAVATPNLTFASISGKTAGSSFTTTASSVSNGAITYSVVSGPATHVGSIITVTGAGTVVLKAYQAANANGSYGEATATTSFTAAVKTNSMTFSSISSKTYGDTFHVNAASPSQGHVTYSIVSGPATITGSAVTVTGHGQVVIKASQVATSEYGPAETTTSFYAAVKTPALAFASISSKISSDVVTAHATSPSQGAIIYSVVSGPAARVGSTIKLTGSGMVVIKAYQGVSPDGCYGEAEATTSFTVTAKK